MRGKFFNVNCSILLGSSMVWGVIALVLALGTPPSPLGAADAKLTGPRANDRMVARAVNKLIKDAHLSKHPLDDEISQRGLHLFLKTLDNRKLYFTQADIAEFEKSKTDLDDQVNNGDVAFAYTAFQKLMERIAERGVPLDIMLKG